MAVSFVRQLGAESGVQLNPLIDQSEMPSFDQSDQVFGIMMRATRGRIDKPFKVHRGNVFKKLGRGELIRINALNEAWVHVVEALNNGAYEAVIQRLSTPNAKVKWAVCRLENIEHSVSLDEVTTVSNAPLQFQFYVSDTEPQAPYLFAVKHLECFNDGICLEFRADEIKDGGRLIANDKITLRLRDKDGELLYSFEGSLDPSAKNEYGNSAYLPDVVASQTDAVEVLTGMNQAKIEPQSPAYGFDTFGKALWVKSDVLHCFDEGGHGYSTQDYMRARELLQYTPFNYAYLSAGASQSPALLAQLAQLAFDTNRQLRFDISGKLSVEAAIAFVEQLNMGANETAHLMQAFWAPFKSDDPTGVNPKGYFGTATLNIAKACLRNAQTNAKGFAPKNYPIAGRDFPINRTNMVMDFMPKSQELSALARAKINPVMYDTFTGGGRFVFKDSLTCALVESSLKKLISVVDMSTTIDDIVTRVAKDYLQKPMDYAVSKTKDFLKDLFDAAEAAKWLMPSEALGGKPYDFDVRPDEMNPYDHMIVSYWLHYDGCARKIFVTQTLSR